MFQLPTPIEFVKSHGRLTEPICVDCGSASIVLTVDMIWDGQSSSWLPSSTVTENRCVCCGSESQFLWIEIFEEGY